MRSIRDSIQTQTQSAEVNLSPLIDVVFLLLIFFVVTTVFVEETGVDVEKPKAMSARELDRRSIMLALTDEGRIVFDGRGDDMADHCGDRVGRRLSKPQQIEVFGRTVQAAEPHSEEHGAFEHEPFAERRLG